MSDYGVMAETHEGNIMTLRRGFWTREAAEDHPVQMSLWKRVWVERLDVKKEADEKLKVDPVLPPKPWDWVASGVASANGTFHAYLVDATGKKIAAIWGGEAKALIADHILDRVNT